MEKSLAKIVATLIKTINQEVISLPHDLYGCIDIRKTSTFVEVSTSIFNSKLIYAHKTKKIIRDGGSQWENVSSELRQLLDY